MPEHLEFTRKFMVVCSADNHLHWQSAYGLDDYGYDSTDIGNQLHDNEYFLQSDMFHSFDQLHFEVDPFAYDLFNLQTSLLPFYPDTRYNMLVAGGHDVTIKPSSFVPFWPSLICYKHIFFSHF